MTMKKTRLTRITAFLCVFVVLIVVGCVTSHVPQGKYLLKKNKLHVKGEKVDESAMEKVIRQQPNLSTFGIKFRLIVFNSIDSTKVAEKRIEKANHLRRKNSKRKARQDRINERRRNRAIRKGKSAYYFRTIELKDTLNPKLSLLERMKYKFGEPPVIVDSFLFRKSIDQLSTYLHKKGYYYDTVTGHLDTLAGKRKIIAHFNVVTGSRYYIDSVYIISDNATVTQSFLNYLRKEPDNSALNEPFHHFLTYKRPMSIPFDQDVLNDYRNKVARYMRNDSYYMFSPSHVLYKADTNSADMSVKLGIVFTDRVVRDPNDPKKNAIAKRHASTRVKQVYFHIADTTLYEGNFRQYLRDHQMDSLRDGFIPTLDTFHYAELVKKVRLPDSLQEKAKFLYYKSQTERNFFGQPKDSVDLDKFRMATFTYNFKEEPKKRAGDQVDESTETEEEWQKRKEEEIFVDPGLIEAQNYLEYTNFYKEYYLERTYNRLIQLGIFALVKPVIEEVEDNQIIVHYYLIPAKKQSYGFEPRATHSNGNLGVSASINYNNKNLFRSGWNSTISFSGGFESQPPVISQDKKVSGRSFNTFEIGPTIKFDLPGLFPVNVAKLTKRQRPRTILSAAYNYQDRPDFERGVFQLSYLWKFYVGKTQVVSVGLPGASVIKFVALTPHGNFADRIESLNDLFLINAYSDQFIWEDMKLVYEYDNRESDRKKQRLRTIFNATFDAAGNLLYYGFRKVQGIDTNGRYKLFGVPYSQFALIDTKFITYYDVNKKHTLAFRALAGVGVPYKNTRTSLPYDYAFFAGGSNDNRGWNARRLGPGSSKYYLDPLRITQIGDIRLGSSVEYRLGKGKLFQSALFADADNIWTINEDIKQQGGQFSKNWYKELGITAGYGIRLDFNFFIFRVDLGLPIHNPGLPEGDRWIWGSRDTYLQEIEDAGLDPNELENIPAPFGPKLQVGIGLPF